MSNSYVLQTLGLLGIWPSFVNGTSFLLLLLILQHLIARRWSHWSQWHGNSKAKSTKAKGGTKRWKTERRNYLTSMAPQKSPKGVAAFVMVEPPPLGTTKSDDWTWFNIHDLTAFKTAVKTSLEVKCWIFAPGEIYQLQGGKNLCFTIWILIDNYSVIRYMFLNESWDSHHQNTGFVVSFIVLQNVQNISEHM